MTVPRRLVLDGRRWKVITADEVFDDAGRSMLGTCDESTRTIEIKQVDDDVMRDVLLHEAIHAMDPTLTERQVLNLERALYAMRTANRAAWAWIFDRQ